MKITIRRFFAFMLALSLMLAIAGTASAATVTWMTTGNKINSATVTKTSDWYYVYKPITGATIARHELGTSNLITWPTGYSAGYAVEFETDSYIYAEYLEEAARLEGLVTSVACEPPTFDYYVVPANLPEGMYSYGIEVTVYDVNWSVILGQSSVMPIADFGPIENQYGSLAGMPASCTPAKLIPVSA